jgi:integrase
VTLASAEGEGIGLSPSRARARERERDPRLSLSLQARHSRSCAIERPWTPFEKVDGCTCKPSYYVVVRDGAKISREKAGKNRKDAERALRKVGVDVDEGTYEPLLSIRFDEWGDRWLKSLERKETTRDGYKSTCDHAKHVFGDKLVRRITTTDIAALNVYLRDDKKLSDSSRAKHLRVLHACLGSAVKHHYAKRNPVEQLPDAERPRPVKTEAPYFEDGELALLFARIPEFVAIDVPNVYRFLFLAALKTGMRQGELLELRWADVDLAHAVLHVRRSITDGYISTPKNRRKREVHITQDVVKMLASWEELSGKPADSELVFPGSTGNHLWPMTILRRELYPAMALTELPDGVKVEAIPRESAEGKRTFHSFRHTFAKRALESGCQITWLSRHLGHSSLAVTSEVYGHWGDAAKREQVAQLEGAFSV